MTSEQQASKELMTRNWPIAHFEGLDKIDTALKEMGSSPDQALQLIEAANEIKDVDFRAAALELLELKKRTGKTSKEAEAYIKELDSQITSKEKQSSDWTGRTEKAKAEFKDWEQKRNGERAAFEREQAQNKAILKEDGAKLNRELNRNKEIRENVEETIALKADLKKVGLNLATFESIVEETVLKSGISPHIAETIKEAVNKLGSLDKAIAERERQEKAGKQAILNLSREEAEKKETLRRLDAEEASMRQRIREQAEQLKSRGGLLKRLNERIELNQSQWEFFELFMAMLVTSPSVGESAEALGVRGSKVSPLTTLALKIRGLTDKGWTPSTELTPAQHRAAFILIVMGLYLRSIRCRQCGASFIVNKAFNAYSSHRGIVEVRRSYCCPVCASSSYTRPDDTFFDLMVSPELRKKLQATRVLLDAVEKTDLEALRKKLKLLDSLPNELYKALSEGRRIEVKVLDGTN
jgi:hypothetical protein